MVSKKIFKKHYNIIRTNSFLKKRKGYLEKIKPYKRGKKYVWIEITNYCNWDKSLCVVFIEGNNDNIFVVDSGVIETLYKEILRLKKRKIIK
jgi:hypothetical protein